MTKEEAIKVLQDEGLLAYEAESGYIYGRSSEKEVEAVGPYEQEFLIEGENDDYIARRASRAYPNLSLCYQTTSIWEVRGSLEYVVGWVIQTK